MKFQVAAAKETMSKSVQRPKLIPIKTVSKNTKLFCLLFFQFSVLNRSYILYKYSTFTFHFQVMMIAFSTIIANDMKPNSTNLPILPRLPSGVSMMFIFNFIIMTWADSFYVHFRNGGKKALYSGQKGHRQQQRQHKYSLYANLTKSSGMNDWCK